MSPCFRRIIVKFSLSGMLIRMFMFISQRMGSVASDVVFVDINSEDNAMHSVRFVFSLIFVFFYTNVKTLITILLLIDNLPTHRQRSALQIDWFISFSFSILSNFSLFRSVIMIILCLFLHDCLLMCF